jgi:hypothetical protein
MLPAIPLLTLRWTDETIASLRFKVGSRLTATIPTPTSLHLNRPFLRAMGYCSGREPRDTGSRLVGKFVTTIGQPQVTQFEDWYYSDAARWPTSAHNAC